MSESDATAPAPWWKRAVFYQVYPRSFMDASGDGVGDLAGLAQRMPYIAELGVDAVWLSPVFRSPMKDFGYDVSDYRDVDPVFGTLADFDAVVAQAHRLGLKLIVDQVWSHTSDQHAWFKDSAASRESARADWYVWADARPDGTPPNNWQASFGGPAWTWNPRRRQYYLHNFLSSQPDLNFHCRAVQDAVLDVARFWLDRGVDGFRLDVINYLAHDPALKDNPVAPYGRTPPSTYRFQRHLNNKSQPETLAFVARLRALLDSYAPERMAVGEIFDDDMVGRQREYTDGPDRLHTAYSFHLLHATRATPELFRSALEPWGGAAGWPSWSLGNHDVPRFATRMASHDVVIPAGAQRSAGTQEGRGQRSGEGGGAGGPWVPDRAPRVRDDDEGRRAVETLLAVLLTLRGTPFLYQGEELGLPHAHVPFERLQDPFAIAAYTGESGRDGARTPMPWEAEAPNAGFSTAVETWLPVDPRHAALAVDVQSAESGSTLAFTRALLALRRAHPALQTGEIAFLAAPAGVLAFERRLGAERLICVFELAGAPAVFSRPDLAGARLLTSGLAAELEGETVRLPGFGGAILILSQDDSGTG